MPPKKYFKEDDDFDGFNDEERPERKKNRFSRQPSEGMQHAYHRGNHASHQSAGAGSFMIS
jgi:hypothetical protein